jgi:hypothetical protein
MGEDNNSPPEKVHNTLSRTLGEWIGKETKYMHIKHILLKTWDKTTTHPLYNMTSRTFNLGQWTGKGIKEIHALSTQTCILKRWARQHATHILRVYII